MEESQRELKKTSSTMMMMIFLVLSFLISVTGGSVLGWWSYKYHAANRQLWMVPFGLVFLLTPIVIWVSIIVSDLCASESREEGVLGMKMKQLVHPVDEESLCSPKRSSEKMIVI